MSSSVYPLHELRALLGGAQALSGVVVASLSGMVDVATATGLQQARAPGRPLTVGERVTVRNGTAYPRAVADRRYVL
jgi:hypothetical protein